MKKLLALLLFSASCWGQLAIVSSRPRVELDSAHRAWMTAKKNGTAAEQAQYAAFYNYISTWYSPTEVISAGKQGGSLWVAIGYTVDPVTFGGAWADKGCRWLEYSLNPNDGDVGGTLDLEVNNNDVTNGNNFRWAPPSLAFAWDALRSHCNTLDPTIGDKFRASATKAWNIMKPGGTNPFSVLATPYRVNNNIGIGQINSMMALAIAAYEPGTFEDPLTWINTMKTAVMDTYVVPCHTTSNVTLQYHVCYGGASTEGMSEYGPEAISLSMQLYDMWRTGVTGVDYSAAQESLARYTLEWIMAGTAPSYVTGTYHNLYRPFNFRDVPTVSSPYHGMFQAYQRQMIGFLTRYFARVGDTVRFSYAQFWSRTIDPAAYLGSPPASQNSAIQARDFTMLDPEDPGVDYRTLSLSKDYLGPFMLLSRSSWNTDATYFGILSMIEGADHMHGDSGTFSIARKGKWLTKEIPGYLYPDARTVCASSAHNVVMTNGHGSWSSDCLSHSGGGFVQTLNAGTNGFVRRAGGGYKSECTSAYCAGEFEVGAPYKFTGYAITPDVDDIRRSFLYLKPDVWVISDIVDYATGVSAQTIDHLQSEKGAPTIVGNRVTIANGNQRLYATYTTPSTGGLRADARDTIRIIEVQRWDANRVAILFNGSQLSAGTFNISGFLAEYAVLNGLQVCSVQPSGSSSGFNPFQDNQPAYGSNRLIVTKTGAFSGLPAFDPRVHGVGVVRNNANTAYQFPIDRRWSEPELTPSSPTAVSTHDPYTAQFITDRSSSGGVTHINKILQAADDTDTPMTISDLTVSTGNAVAQSFTLPGDSIVTEVITPTLLTPTFPISFTRTGVAAKQYYRNLTPGATYKVSESANVSTIDTSGAGASIVASTAGVVIAEVDAGVVDPSITIAVSSATVNQNCTVGGADPAPSNVTVTASGGAGVASITPTGAPSWLTPVLSGGAAPQNTPQTLTFTSSCAGLAANTYVAQINITSATANVINSPIITVTLTVNPSGIADVDLTTASLVAGVQGTAYSDSLSCTGGTSPYTYSVASGTLHSGLSLNSSTGAITGTPTVSGTNIIVFRCTDSQGSPDTDDATISLAISPAATVLALSGPASVAMSLGSTQTFQFEATGGSESYTYSVVGTLPTGCSIAASTGLLSCTPSVIGDFNVDVCVDDGIADLLCVSRTISINTTGTDVTMFVTLTNQTAVVKITRSGLLSDQTCKIVARDESGAQVGTAEVNAGPSTRAVVLTLSDLICPLPTCARVTFAASCGASLGGSTTTVVANFTSGTATLTFAGAPLTANNVVVDYGTTTALGSTSNAGSCSGGHCTTSITGLTRGIAYYIRQRYRDAGNNTIATGSIAPVTLP